MVSLDRVAFWWEATRFIWQAIGTEALAVPPAAFKVRDPSPPTGFFPYEPLPSRLMSPHPSLSSPESFR